MPADYYCCRAARIAMPLLLTVHATGIVIPAVLQPVKLPPALPAARRITPLYSAATALTFQLRPTHRLPTCRIPVTPFPTPLVCCAAAVPPSCRLPRCAWQRLTFLPPPPTQHDTHLLWLPRHHSAHFTARTRAGGLHHCAPLLACHLGLPTHSFVHTWPHKLHHTHSTFTFTAPPAHAHSPHCHTCPLPATHWVLLLPLLPTTAAAVPCRLYLRAAALPLLHWFCLYAACTGASRLPLHCWHACRPAVLCLLLATLPAYLFPAPPTTTPHTPTPHPTPRTLHTALPPPHELPPLPHDLPFAPVAFTHSCCWLVYPRLLLLVTPFVDLLPVEIPCRCPFLQLRDYPYHTTFTLQPHPFITPTPFAYPGAGWFNLGSPVVRLTPILPSGGGRPASPVAPPPCPAPTTPPPARHAWRATPRTGSPPLPAAPQHAFISTPHHRSSLRHALHLPYSLPHTAQHLPAPQLRLDAAPMLRQYAVLVAPHLHYAVYRRTIPLHAPTTTLTVTTATCAFHVPAVHVDCSFCAALRHYLPALPLLPHLLHRCSTAAPLQPFTVRFALHPGSTTCLSAFAPLPPRYTRPPLLP